ncbi:hypothetical protein U0070_013070 [Myodes glareolus]|uniref:BEACH-type PH domain-containing protein n=1 Tax=Myodes glareolus TaxID=447135 RepID=A0AAW0IWI7_MYOGA
MDVKVLLQQFQPDVPWNTNSEKRKGFQVISPRIIVIIEEIRSPVVLSTPAQLIAPVVVAKGTLSITTTEIYFEVDEDDAAFKKIDTKVS